MATAQRQPEWIGTMKSVDLNLNYETANFDHDRLWLWQLKKVPACPSDAGSDAASSGSSVSEFVRDECTDDSADDVTSLSLSSAWALGGTAIFDLFNGLSVGGKTNNLDGPDRLWETELSECRIWIWICLKNNRVNSQSCFIIYIIIYYLLLYILFRISYNWNNTVNMNRNHMNMNEYIIWKLTELDHHDVWWSGTVGLE